MTDDQDIAQSMAALDRADEESFLAGQVEGLREWLDQAISERDLLAQAMHDARGILGFDNDGDKTPRAYIAGMGFAGFADMHRRDATEARKDDDETFAESMRYKADRDRLVGQVAAVRALHRKVSECYRTGYDHFCAVCITAPDEGTNEPWPCPTIRALGDAV